MALLNEVYEASMELIPLTLPQEITKDSSIEEPLLYECRHLYKHFKIVFLPFIFWS